MGKLRQFREFKFRELKESSVALLGQYLAPSRACRG
jgi:hypothetical protein